VDLDDDNILRYYLKNIVGGSEADSIGLWCYETINGDTHTDITNIDLGSKIDVARGFGITSLVLGFCIWLSYLIAVCVLPPQRFSS
jgi:hypothetical protein